MEIPSFDYDSETGLCTLTSSAWYETRIQHPRPLSTRYMRLISGTLMMYEGYKWDLGSGPAVNDPAMINASLAHDGLYELISRGLLPLRYRKDADRVFRELLKEGGVGWFRRSYCWLAVRLFGGYFVQPDKH